MDQEYEYGIVFTRMPNELHRGPMSLAEAKLWIQECDDMGMAENAFSIVRRPTGPWALLDNDDKQV